MSRNLRIVTRQREGDGSALGDGHCGTVAEEPVNYLGMSCDLANIGHAGEAVGGVNFKDVFDSGGGREEVVSVV